MRGDFWRLTWPEGGGRLTREDREAPVLCGVRRAEASEPAMMALARESSCKVLVEAFAWCLRVRSRGGDGGTPPRDGRRSERREGDEDFGGLGDEELASEAAALMPAENLGRPTGDAEPRHGAARLVG